jgi:hypothetical protein
MAGLEESAVDRENCKGVVISQKIGNRSLNGHGIDSDVTNDAWEEPRLLKA